MREIRAAGRRATDTFNSFRNHAHEGTVHRLLPWSSISFRFISRKYSQLPVWVWYNVHSKFSLRVHSSHVSSTGFASFADVDPGVRVPFASDHPPTLASPA